jgi:hypothetical protein
LTPGDGELPTSVGEFPHIQKPGRATNADELSKILVTKGIFN